MALFRSTRTPPPPVGGPETPSSGVARPAPSLADKVRQISKDALPEDALEQALELLIETTGAAAGAVCFYDARHEILRLAAERGLSDEGCQRLRTIRRNDPSSWDMPLNGLINRRVYLIETAAQNRYVPRLVPDGRPVKTVACVPLVLGGDPVGALVLVSLAPRSLAERDIQAISGALREVVQIIHAVRQRVLRAPVVAPPPLVVVPSGASVAEAGPMVAGAPAAEPGPTPVVVAPAPAVPPVATPVAPAPTPAPVPKPAFDTSALLAQRDSLVADLAVQKAERARLGEQCEQLARERDRLLARLDEAQGDDARMASALERSQQESQRAHALQQALETAEHERERLAASLASLASVRAEQAKYDVELEQARSSAERGRDAAVDEARRAREGAEAREAAAARRVAELEATIEAERHRAREAETSEVAEHERLRDLETEVARLGSALDAAAVNEIRLREELQAVEERRLAASNADSREAIEAVRAAGKARARADSDAERARAEAAAATARVEQLEQDLGAARGDVERFRAQLEAGSSGHGELEAQLEELRVREQQLQLRVAEQAEAHEALRAEHDALREARHAQDAEVGTVLARLEALAAERDQLAERVASLDNSVNTARAEAESATSARASMQAELARERTERARLGSEVAALETRAAGLEAARAQHEAELTERGTLIQQVSAERDVLRSECDRLAASLATAEAALPDDLPAPEETTAPDDGYVSEFATVEVVTEDQLEHVTHEVVEVPILEPIAVAPVVSVTPVATAPTVMIIDASPGWAGLTLAGHTIVSLKPEDSTIETILSGAPTRVIANLACPGVLEIVLAARAASASLRIWGCIADSESGMALPLGMIERVPSPLDPDAVMGLLPSYVARGGRMVTAGTDVDALMSLRQAAGRDGIGVSMAWDAKQVADLLPAVRPHVVLIDLDLPRRDGYAVLAGLSAVEVIPHAIVVGGGAGETAAAFAGMLRDVRYTAATWSVARYAADVMNRSQDAPVAASARKVVGRTFK